MKRIHYPDCDDFSAEWADVVVDTAEASKVNCRRCLTKHPTVAWFDFESEPDMTGDGSGDPETHYLTIAFLAEDTSMDDEIAVICHRTVGDKYPIDGELANEKRRYAQVIVEALNRITDGHSYAERLVKED